VYGVTPLIGFLHAELDYPLARCRKKLAIESGSDLMLKSMLELRNPYCGCAWRIPGFEICATRKAYRQLLDSGNWYGTISCFIGEFVAPTVQELAD
jgi:hypothetical protein